MPRALEPNDCLGRHPGFCMAAIVILVLLNGVVDAL